MKSLDLCVVGAGYVGLVTGACLAEIGHRVVCVDSDAKKLKSLKAGKVPIHEPGLEELFRKHVRSGRLAFVASVEEGLKFKGRRAAVVFIAVGTPPRHDGSADLSAVEAVAETVAKHMDSYTVIVDKSTVPVETGEWVSRTVQRFNKSGTAYDVVSNPEFLSEGSAVKDFLHPDRVVLGTASKRAEAVMRAVYAPLKTTILATDVKSAELIKHASNSFLATKISYINAVSALCEKVGADVKLVAQGMGLDRRIGPMFLNAGIGFGGFCFPKDLEAFYWISKQKGYDFQLLKSVKEVNEHQKGWVARKIEEKLWNLEGKTVALLGLAFKPDTDDMRFAPSLDVAAQLRGRGVRLRAFDPVAAARAKVLPEFKGVYFARDEYDAVKGADAVAVVTEWPRFKALDLKRLKRAMRTPVLLDGRNVFDPAVARAAGFEYAGVGRP
ncbi:MAG: UDP-glucose/GDP-mannose dehydrogenase family protein [Elusimicrobia bacterium]|nr:UDP-glucose/GDP-mannose dehydrogenase family protein [Elusimicrobiota bacterium]